MVRHTQTIPRQLALKKLKITANSIYYSLKGIKKVMEKEKFGNQVPLVFSAKSSLDTFKHQYEVALLFQLEQVNKALFLFKQPPNLS